MELGQYLEPGRVLHLYCRFPSGTEKYKLLVLADNDEECLFFVVNSDINDFIKNRQHLLTQQIALSWTDHAFLSHDSWLDCSNAHPIQRTEVMRQLNDDPSGCLRGMIGLDLKREIIEVVETSLTLEPIVQELVKASLSD